LMTNGLANPCGLCDAGHMTRSADEEMSDRGASADPPAHRVRLPRFLVSEPIGFGQVVKRMTGAAGVKPCGPCEQRAARLNSWLRFEPRR
jgi:hypothetical protein